MIKFRMSMRILPRCKLHLPAFLVILSYFWHNFSPPEDFTSVKTRFFPSFFVKKEILFLIRIPFSVHNFCQNLCIFLIFSAVPVFPPPVPALLYIFLLSLFLNNWLIFFNIKKDFIIIFDMSFEVFICKEIF